MKTIPQRTLRNESGEVLRPAEAGERFVVTVHGRPVAVLGPYGASEERRALRLRRLAEIESRFTPLPIDEEVARAYGELAALTAGTARR